MRTEKELWEVVLSRPDLFHAGLCVWIIKILNQRIITDEEELSLRRVISSKRNNNKIYWIGPFDNIQPRIDWINERIKQI